MRRQTLERGLRKRVTLIAAMRCKDGIVMCADSQETIGHYRCAVQKITPITEGAIRLVIAGSGTAELIEAFIVVARDALLGCPEDINEVRRILQQALTEFYRSEVPLWPLRKKDKQMRLFIAVSVPSQKQYDVWATLNTRLKAVGEYELIGWDEPLYRVSAKQLCCNGMSLSMGAVAATNVLMVAKETSNYVGGDLSLSIVKANGIFSESTEYIRSLEERLRVYQTYSNLVLMVGADMAVHSLQLKAFLEKISSTVVAIHEQQINASVSEMWKSGKEHWGDTIPKCPNGLLVVKQPDGTRVIRHDVDGIQHMIDVINSANATTDESEDTMPSTPETSEGQQ